MIQINRMCWNEKVSINTFIFSTFAIIFAYYNNIITVFQGLFLLCVFSMQLIEFFLWRNINDKNKNEFYSRVAEYSLAFQPLFSLMTIPHPTIKYICCLLYLLFLGMVKLVPWFRGQKPYISTVGTNGHLRWNWMETNPIKVTVYMLGLFIPLLLWKHKLIFVIFLLTLLASVILYRKDKTWGSLWCWSANLISLYLIYCVFAKEFCKV